MAALRGLERWAAHLVDSAAVQTLRSIDDAGRAHADACAKAATPAACRCSPTTARPGRACSTSPHLDDAAERGIRLLSYDRPGYGVSTRQPGRDVADCAADVAAICDALGIERLLTWGVSGGGPHALARRGAAPRSRRGRGGARVGRAVRRGGPRLHRRHGRAERRVDEPRAGRRGGASRAARARARRASGARRRSSSSTPGARSSAPPTARC